MSTVPLITIFVRHLPRCKYSSDEFAKRCTCRKHLRWTHHGTQYRRAANTRDWGEAEQEKRKLEDQLSGKLSDARETASSVKSLEECISLFAQDKTVQGIDPRTIRQHKLELGRLKTYCEQQGVFVIHGITRELLTGFCGTWETFYPSSFTRMRVRERLSGFLNYCFETQWLSRKPPLPRIKLDYQPTMPLTANEYARLLVAALKMPDARDAARLHALFQLMRWSGLAIFDALTLKRAGLVLDEDGIYSVVTRREKTGTDVRVPLPPAVARELLAVPNEHAEHIFWNGKGEKASFTGRFGSHQVYPAFEAAEIPDVCKMKSHRLRDTFAVDLLTKGVPLEEVSKLLGHNSIRTTEKHYAKWVAGRQARLKSLVVGTWTPALEAQA